MSAPEPISSLLATKRAVDLSALYEIEPGLCGMTMFVPIVELPDQQEPIVVDSRRMYVGPALATRDSQQQAFLIAHALLHFALGHPARRRRAAAAPEFLHALWTVAADAIVNDSLAQVKTIIPPAGEVSMDDILAIVPAARTMSLEQLYAALTTFWSDARLTAMLERLERNFRHDISSDSESAVVDGSGHADEATPEEWRERLKRGFGRYPAGFERLLGHLPQTKTRWEHALRSLVAQSIGDREHTDPSRPHRRWLALHRTLRAQGVTLPMMPGIRPKPQPRVAVAIDTSGSIDTVLLTRFLAEIGGIMRQLGAGVRVITADAAVHQIRDFTRPDELLAFKPAGGGGTNFDPAIDAADDYRPSVLVYFTDLEAPTPRKPRYPVIWAVPIAAHIPKQPFGRRLEIT